MRNPTLENVAMNNKNWFHRIGIHTRLYCLVLFVSGCATVDQQVSCPAGQVGSTCIPVDAIEDARVSSSYEARTWIAPEVLEIDTIKLAIEAKIPVLKAQAKFFGPSQEDGLRSLAAKIWMIDHAEHTIDATYYIFSRDLVGRAVIGALCNAVERGVDVRLMVDSAGSWHLTHPYLKSLANCSDKAGFMRNADGQVTNKRARAQVLIFNALSKMNASMNRRSHDKMLVIDGYYPDKAIVLTGGRNVSLDYYGIREDGSVDPEAFKDLEMLLKPAVDQDTEGHSVGSISEIYLSVIYLNRGNKFLTTWTDRTSEAEESQQALGILRSFDNFDHYYREMDSYMIEGFFEADVRLAHELGNLESKNVVANRVEILNSNPNSIAALLDRVVAEIDSLKRIRIVSPYLFLAEFTTASGEVYFDGKDALDDWLAADPERTIEIITNSVLTSDNYMAQSMIDIGMMPRVLLTPELREAWQAETWEGETNPEVVESEEWKQLVANPRIIIYQLGKLDSEILGGEKYYGKLHAKFILADEIGSVGTTNLDYRSRLYNNEMGFFFRSDGLIGELTTIFEDLRKDSYLWGTPEWLKMRDDLRRAGGTKGNNTYKQRKTYKFLERSGLKWQI
jgi:putative cardiolipin synthase